MEKWMTDQSRQRAVLSVIMLAALTPLVQCGQQELFAQSPTQIAQSPTPDARLLEIDRGSVGLWQLLLKLHTRASLINIVGHPDDEAGAMLTYEGRGHGVRTSLIQMNRGEGGQNAMNNDYYDALGLDRTEELLAADRFYGTIQHFVLVPDLGFSKSKEEALSLWTRDRTLGDVVRTIRMERPLVITSENVGGPTDGHGHHQVAGEMAQEAFLAAGDPKAFPEQIKEGLLPWKALKMYARVPSPKPKGIFDQGTGNYLPVRFQDFIDHTWIEGIPSVNVTIPTGTYDPFLGGYYTQISREGLGYQKSQGQGAGVPEPQPSATSYHRYASLVSSREKEETYFDGIDVSLMGIADLAKGQNSNSLRQSLTKVNGLVEQSIERYSAVHPDLIASNLAEGLKETNQLIEQVQGGSMSNAEKYDVLHELQIKQTQFNNALALSLGLYLEAEVQGSTSSANQVALPGDEGPAPSAPRAFEFATPGQQFIVRLHFAIQGTQSVQLHKVWLESPQSENWITAAVGTAVLGKLNANSATEQRFSVTVPNDAGPTVPYFSRKSIEQPYYDVTDSHLRTLPFNPYPLAARAVFDFEGAEVMLSQYVQRPKRTPGIGNVLEPVEVAPLISVAISPHAGIVPLNQSEFKLDVMVKSEVEGSAEGTLKLDLPAGWKSNPESIAFSAAQPGEERTSSFTVLPSGLAEQSYTITAVANYKGHDYKSGFVTTGYPGLRSHNLFSEAQYRTSGVDVKVAPGLRVGYVEGTGDEVPHSLESLGVKVEFLSSQDLASGNLQKFDVIVLGVRTYAARPELPAYNGRLLDYVKNGGVVVVQYQSGQYDHNFGPYPYTLGTAQRVVVEAGEAQILDPKSAVLSWPNQISASDLNGWVEERGHGFMDKWDGRYESPTEMHDPGQDPQKGGLLLAKYGKGAYVYVAFALYRQLPEGVPGAYRIFANLLSLSKNPAITSSGVDRASK
jgi:LmbE family N-acetylglucosaminyl deacetylase